MQAKTAMPPKSAVSSSIVTVAAQAGVSIATVSRVMNGVAGGASPATAERVRQAAAALGYRPLSVGRTLRQKRSRLVALLAANLANPAMTAMAASIETALRRKGLVMVLCDTHDRPELQDEYLLEMRAQLVCATVLRGGRLRRDTVSLWISGASADCYGVVPLAGRCAGRA